MAYSQGRSRLQYWLDVKGISQSELARRTGWSKDKDTGDQKDSVGWSPRMISFFCTGSIPMSPAALYTISRILNVGMDELNDWDEVN